VVIEAGVISPVTSQTEEVHAPDTHASPDEHAFPQAPQFCGSVSVITHAPEHAVHPARQTGEQLPPEQDRTAFVIAGQTLPQAPQF
jgi:hypothetical protein